MKRTFLGIAAILLPIGLQAREIQTLNFGWEFENSAGEKTAVDLPHDFQVGQPWVLPSSDETPDKSDGAANQISRLSARGFKEMGVGTYRRTLTITPEMADRRILLDFGGIMLVGDVYLNGERIGGTDYGHLGFEIDITDKAKPGDNDLMVIADTGAPNNSRWYTGGGLYRSVNLVTTGRNLYFNRHGLQIATSDISADSAVVTLTGDINARRGDAFTADMWIYAPNGECVAQKSETIKIVPRWRNREYPLGSITIPNPELWDIDSPNLYRAEIKLRDASGEIVDDMSDNFGIRTIEFSPDFGFKLNGRKVYLKGISNHNTYGELGAAAYPAAIERQLKRLKEFGFNHVRCSHNPYSEEFYDLCDKYGFVVTDELYDKWLQQYAGGRKPWTELWQNDVPEWIRRDRNHPSVIIWSLGNELQGYSNLPHNDWGVTAYRLLHTLLQRYDTSRPVTVAMHPRYRSLETDSLPAPLVHETDIAAYNYRYMYFPGDGRRFPHMMFYQSEANLPLMGPNFFIPQAPNVLGLAYWGMIDYQGESLGWPAKGWTDGVFDISLNPKPNAWFIKSMFMDDVPTVHIGIVNPGGRITTWNDNPIGGEVLVDHWNHAEGDSLKLYTYTNADEVALMLNGRMIGRKANDKADPNVRNKITWENVPYAKGTLEAVAYTGGKEVARHKIRTAGKAVKIVATPENASWRADGMDLQYISIAAVDKNGTVVPDAAALLHFDIDGDAQLVAVNNGDITSNENFTGNTRSLYRGRALAVLRAGREEGECMLTITSEELPPVKIRLNSLNAR